jgi:hypothetical protein
MAHISMFPKVIFTVADEVSVIDNWGDGQQINDLVRQMDGFKRTVWAYYELVET